MQRHPIVSVLMPVRYGPDFVAEATNSILGQTFRDFEFIIIDDGAPSACKTKLADIARADSRIALHPASGNGIVDALNQGLRIARGEYVARMDADDVALPARLESLLDALEKRRELAVVGSSYRIIDEHGVTQSSVTLPPEPKAIRDTLATSNCMCHPSVMMRKDAVLATGGYRYLTACEDFDLWVRLSERHDLANLPQPLLLYRRHAGQATWRALEERLLSEVAIQASAKARAQGRPDLPLDRQPPSAALLEASGITPSQRRQAMRDRALVAAMHAINGADRQQARAALAIARRHGAMLSSEADRYWKLMVKFALMSLRAPAARA